METTMTFNDCLTYEQLQAYTANKNNLVEHTRLYMHISACELCACAVNGFTAIPFVSNDLVAIHREIDARTNTTHASPLTFAQVCIVIASFVSIFSFYRFTNNVSESKIRTIPLKEDVVALTMPKENKRIESYENKTSIKGPVVKQIQITDCVFPKRISLPMEHFESHSVGLMENVAVSNDDQTMTLSSCDVMYIDDLKVADYNKLYFKTPAQKFDLGNYTPSFKENEKASPLFENEADQSIAATTVLKKGLHYFNKNKYGKAIEQFQLLLENNPDDVNALFYSAIAFRELGKNEIAVKNLEAVLQNSNTAFYPEGKWNLALVLIKTDKEKTKQLLKEIESEKGFYANRAKELLKKM